MSDIYLAKLNIHKLKNYYQNKKNELEKALLQAQEPTATLRQKKELGNLEDQLKKVNKEAAAVDEIKAEEIVLSAVITAKYKDKVWIVHGGNRDILKFVNANYELYYRIICDAKTQGYHWVDFFGAEGNVDQSSNLYGITMFKMRFGGDFDEFIGEFDLEYKLTKNGEIRLKAYNHANDMYQYLRQSMMTQGVGLMFKKDFTTFSEIFHRNRLKNTQAEHDSIPAASNDSLKIKETPLQTNR